MNARSCGLALGCLVAAVAVWAQPAAGPRLLFAGVAERLPVADQQAIFRLLDYRVAPGGKALVAPDCGEVAHETQVLDLNSDGVPEVLVIAGNGCTSGHTGSSVFLFVKNAQGRYTQQLGFPGASVTPLATRSQGWQDLRIGTAGFCEPVWAWKGAAYDLLCSVETQRRGCRGLGPVKLCRR
jgi:hypothetical protein